MIRTTGITKRYVMVCDGVCVHFTSAGFWSRLTCAHVAGDVEPPCYKPETQKNRRPIDSVQCSMNSPDEVEDEKGAASA